MKSASDDGMPRPRPLHLVRDTNRRSGETMWYVRVGHGPRIRIRGAYGSPEFMESYRAAVAGEPPKKPGAAKSGSLKWLIDQYRQTMAWDRYSAATQKQRNAIFANVIKAAGDEPFVLISRKVISTAIDDRRKTPNQARHFLDAMRDLFAWALQAEHVKVNPCDGIKPPSKASGADDGGFEVWLEEDIAKFEARWPVGTRPRVAFDVLRYTGLRRGDAARLGRPHAKDGIIQIKTDKTGEWVTLNMVPALAATIAAGPCGELTFIAGETGKPLTKESFGNRFRDWCNAAGVKGKSAHGLRKYAATAMAEAGATVHELESVFGWSGGRMAALYTKSANRRKLGLSGSEKLPGSTVAEHPNPVPDGCAGSTAKNTRKINSIK